MSPLILDNPVRTYAWGSPTVIPDLLGRAPTGEPQAELWMGAHPADPSLVELDGTRVSLAELIDKDPEAMLGAAVLDRFGARLPYLLKVLAVERPLSIQAHPTLEQARAGYDAEQRAGVPIDAPNRSYRDRFHKPELIVALTDFDALIGFRRPAQTAELLDALHLPALSDAAAQLRTDGPAALARIVRHWLELSDGEAAALVQAAAAAGAGSGGELADLLPRLVAQHPGDRGVLLATLLRPVRLAPGEAAFTAAGVPHAYLHGVAVEVQASSDNTLRAGLTAKHIDAGELIRVLRYETSGQHVFTEPGIEEFRLIQAGLGAETEPAVAAADGPRIVLITEGDAQLRTAGRSVTLRRGQAAFVPAADGPATLTGHGTAFVATTNLDPVSTAR